MTFIFSIQRLVSRRKLHIALFECASGYMGEVSIAKQPIPTWDGTTSLFVWFPIDEFSTWHGLAATLIDTVVEVCDGGDGTGYLPVVKMEP